MQIFSVRPPRLMLPLQIKQVYYLRVKKLFSLKSARYQTISNCFELNIEYDKVDSMHFFSLFNLNLKVSSCYLTLHFNTCKKGADLTTQSCTRKIATQQ